MLPCMNSCLSNAEKLVCVQRAIKKGSARAAVEGLSRSGDHCVETIDCLKSRYDHPRFINHAHVWKIMEAPSYIMAWNCESCMTHFNNICML